MTTITLPEKTRRLFERSAAAMRVLDAVFSPDAVLSLERVMGLYGRKDARISPATNRFAFWDVIQRIRAARLEKGWTQQRLADYSGIARANIARLEAGRHAPRIDTIELLARALSLPLAKLFETSVSASNLRNLNEMQLRAGTSPLQETLKALREKGVIDEKGKRITKKLPAEMRKGTSDAV